MADGIVLVLVSGLLTIFLLLATTFTRLTEFAGTGTSARRAAHGARIAAASGLEYAAARLWEEPRGGKELWPVLDAVNARDDWTARGNEPPATPPARLANPSWPHGEPWQDTLNADGSFDNDWFFDTDGNGRYDVRTGRLRGAPGGRDALFALAIRSSEGKACVNSGVIDSPSGDWDLDGILDADDPRPSTDTNGNNVPDWRDPDHIENRHLVNLLDNLGAILKVSTSTKVPFWPADPSPADGPGEPGFIETSDLGRRVVAGRPRGGYVSIPELSPVLGQDYPLAAPYLAVAGRIVPMTRRHDASASGVNITLPPLAYPSTEYEFQALIDFNRSPVEVLAASLRQICASGNWNAVTTSWENPDNCISPFIRLGADEADRIAERLAGARPIPTWRAFLGALHAVSGALEDDPFTVGIDEKTDPLWRLLKEDLILAQVMPKNYRHDPYTLRMNGLEVARETVQEGPDLTCQRRLSPLCLQQPLIHASPFNDQGQVQFNKTLGGYIEGIPCRETAGYFLDWGAGTGLFEIDASGWISGHADVRIQGSLATFPGEIRLAGQQDFEQASPSLTGLGAVPWRYPGGTHEALGPRQEKTKIDTYPKFPIDSFTTAGMPAAEKARYPYSRSDGGLRLQAAQTETIDSLASCTFAVPFNQDPPVNPSDRWYTHTSNGDDDWQDQISDPVGTPALHRSPDPSGFGISNKGESFINRGYFTGPEGPRYRIDPKIASSLISPGTLSHKWNGSVIPPFPGGPVKIMDCTIACWYPAAGESPLWPLSPTGNLAAYCLQGRFVINREMMISAYLDVTFEGNSIVLSDTSATHTIVPWWTSDPVAGAALWHHLAISFNADGTRAKVFCDGREELDVPIDSASGNDDTTLFLYFPLDDFRVLVPGIQTEAEAVALAQEDRYARTGTYRSPRSGSTRPASPGGRSSGESRGTPSFPNGRKGGSA